MDLGEETTLNDDVLESIDEKKEEDTSVDPLSEIKTDSSDAEEETVDEDDLDDAKLFGGVDDKDEGYNPLEETNPDDWN